MLGVTEQQQRAPSRGAQPSLHWHHEVLLAEYLQEGAISREFSSTLTEKKTKHPLSAVTAEGSVWGEE